MTIRKTRRTPKVSRTAAARTAARMTAAPVVEAPASPAAAGTGALPVAGSPASGAPTGAEAPVAPGSAQGPSAAAIAAGHGPATAGGSVGTGVSPAATPARTAARATGSVSRLRKPMRDQAFLTESVAMEVRRSVTAGRYRNLFGEHAPDPEGLAAAVERAGQLSREEAATRQTWTAVRDARNKAWDHALVDEVDPFKACFDLAEAHDATVVTDFPSTKAFLRTGAQIGARGAATRKAKKLAKPGG